MLIVDAHPLAREALAGRVRAMGAGTVHETASVSEARALARSGVMCDLAILDLGPSPSDGVQLLGELHGWGWPRLVVLASSGNPSTARAVFQAGARAYLLKSCSPAILTDGLARVLGGGVYADPAVVPLLVNGTPGRGGEDQARELSKREVQVLQLVADGHSNKEIGHALTLSALTVKSHLARIGRKLGTGDRAHMVALAIRAAVIH